MALDIPVDSDDIDKMDDNHAELAMWVMDRVNRWRDYRNARFQKRWSEYYRLWRGFWDSADKNKEAERSRLIAPALQQAIEMTVAEEEEAIFGRKTWVDLADDYSDEEKEDVIVLRDMLLEEMDCNGVPAAVSEALLNGALYGNGIGKVLIGRDSSDNFKAWVEPIAPGNFVIDPVARSIDEALGVAHEIGVPKHKVLAKQQDGIYYSYPVGTFEGEIDMFNSQGEVLSREMDNYDVVFVTEYHGLVPKRLLYPQPDKVAEPEVYKDFDGAPEIDNEELVEAIVTVANKAILLRAVENPYENPYSKTDRAIFAYAHETVPNSFWGRSVSEKGYNPQKALDAELRARIDALGLLTYPVMGIDATRIPRGVDFKIKPGKSILTNGRPSEVLEPIVFGNLNPATFQQSSDLERMVQMGTGAMDSASPLEDQRRNETVGGMSMINSGAIKRAKRTMQNLERQFLTPMVTKLMYRYMQFDPERFPQDFKFQVKSALGIMAKEIEQASMTQMLQIVPPESPLFNVILKGIVEAGSSPIKGEMLKAIDAQTKPDPAAQAAQQEVQRLQMENAQLENNKLQAEVGKALAEAELARARAELVGVQASFEDEKIEIMAAQTALSNKKIDAQIHTSHMQAQAKQQSDAQKAKQKPKNKGK